MARRIALAQIGAGLLSAAIAALAFSAQVAMAAVMGVLAVLLGTLVLSRMALRGGVQSAEAVMLRLVLGIAVKWLVIAVVLLLALAVWRLPPLALLAGVVAAFLATALAALKKN